jgi:hypothetical protein
MCRFKPGAKFIRSLYKLPTEDNQIILSFPKLLREAAITEIDCRRISLRWHHLMLIATFYDFHSCVSIAASCAASDVTFAVHFALASRLSPRYSETS